MAKMGSVSLILIVLLILLAGAGLAIKNGSIKLTDQVKLPSISPLMSPTSQPNTTPSPSTSTDPSPSASANIILKSPQNGAEVGKQFTISGFARVFENVLQVRVKNNRTNAIYVNQNIMANSPDTGQFGDFTYNVNLTNQTDLRMGDPLLVEAFQYSAKDGSEIDKVSAIVQTSP